MSDRDINLPKTRKQRKSQKNLRKNQGGSLERILVKSSTDSDSNAKNPIGASKKKRGKEKEKKKEISVQKSSSIKKRKAALDVIEKVF